MIESFYWVSPYRHISEESVFAKTGAELLHLGEVDEDTDLVSISGTVAQIAAAAKMVDGVPAV